MILPLVNVGLRGRGSTPVNSDGRHATVDGGRSLLFTTAMAARLSSKESIKQSGALRLLMILVAIDLLFLVIHASHVRFDVPGSGRWLISRDRGFPEIFQYLKAAAAAGFLVRCFVANRSPVCLAWSAIFTYLLLDDALEVHETAGEALADALGLNSPLGIEGRDFGQILVSAAAGCVVLALVIWTARKDRATAVELSIPLLLALGALAFFGIVADVVDAIDLFGLVEDGGEMIAMSIAAVIAADHHPRHVRRRAGPAATSAR